MRTEQSLAILDRVAFYYPSFTIVEKSEALMAWTDILDKYDYETVLDNLMEHVETSRFAPTIADLLQLEKPKKHEETAASKSIAYLPWSEEIQAERDEEARQMRISIEGEKELTPEEIQRGKDFIKAMKERRKFNNGNKQ